MNPLILTECDQCGQCFEATGNRGAICNDCEAEHAELVAEQEADRWLENALACKCGAWGISYMTGNPFHVADCVCGNT